MYIFKESGNIIDIITNVDIFQKSLQKLFPIILSRYKKE